MLVGSLNNHNNNNRTAGAGSPSPQSSLQLPSAATLVAGAEEAAAEAAEAVIQHSRLESPIELNFISGQSPLQRPTSFLSSNPNFCPEAGAEGASGTGLSIGTNKVYSSLQQQQQQQVPSSIILGDAASVSAPDVWHNSTVANVRNASSEGTGKRSIELNLSSASEMDTLF